MSDNYFERERDAWLECRRGRFTASEISRLFVSGTRPMTQEELDARPKFTKKDGTEGARVLGGTTVPTMFGDAAINYIRSKVDELISEPAKDEPGSFADFKQTDWGIINEYPALERFEAITGKNIINYGGYAPKFFPHGDFAGGSPDGDIVAESALIEVKCPYNTDVHTRRLLYDKVEDVANKEWDIYCQCQALMRIMGRDFAYFCSFDPRKRYKHLQMKIIKIPADLEWHKEYDERIKGAIEVMKIMLTKCEKHLIIE